MIGSQAQLLAMQFTGNSIDIVITDEPLTTHVQVPPGRYLLWSPVFGRWRHGPRNMAFDPGEPTKHGQPLLGNFLFGVIFVDSLERAFFNFVSTDAGPHTISLIPVTV